MFHYDVTRHKQAKLKDDSYIVSVFFITTVNFVQILDTRDLSIKKVVLLPSGTEVDFKLDEPTLAFGSKLTIELPQSSDAK